ncbi:S8 family peptidase [Streptomyces sp. CA-251387]|uniref:S8 family peptidase n=1 Tax=Streptomyces sp. CA-251387 TaxID=3240064 RepID=UPI003D92A2B0
MAVMRTTWRNISAVALAVTLSLGAGTVGTAVTIAGPSEGAVANAGAPEVIKDSYIVTLRANVDARSPRAKDVAKKFGARITRTYDQALNGYAVKLTKQQARRLAADPAVESVVQDQIVTASATQPSPPSWGLDRIDQRALPLNASYTYPDGAGQGVTAYIIDTGVRITHQDFGGRASYGYDAVDGDHIAADGNGHGTHVAATVAGTSHGVAKKAKIVAVRVLNNNGSGTISGVIAGIDWVTQHAVKPAVANMSLGGGANATLDTAVRNSIAAGITYAVAAGNSNSDASGFSPARVSEALTVSATTNTDARAGYSNYGSIIDLFAPGSSITSAWNSSDTATNTISGTSMATPHVAGAAALHLAANPTSAPSQVASALTLTATTGAVTSPGTGSPNRLLFVGTTPGGSRFENTADYPISDFTTTQSPITVSGVPGNAPSTLRVSVDIKHTWIGDLQIDLVAPDGSAYRLKNYRDGGSSDNVNTTYTLNASTEAANGTWKLRVSDNAWYDTGKVDSWALRF